MICAGEQCGKSYKDVAQVLFMCEKSVQRYLAIFHATGNVSPHEQKRGPEKSLTDFELFTILQSLIIKPTSFLCEIQQQFLQSTGKWVHASTMIYLSHYQRTRVDLQESTNSSYTTE